LYYFFIWNGSVRFMTESYVPVLLVAVQEKYEGHNKRGTVLEVTFSLLNLATCIVFTTAPLLITIHLRRNIKKFRKASFKKKWGEVIEELSHKRASSANQVAIFFYRRLTLIVLLVFFAG